MNPLPTETTILQLYRFFEEDSREWRKSRVLQRIQSHLASYLRGEAPSCHSFVFETLLRRISSYDPSRSLEAWIFGAVDFLVPEWLKSKAGAGQDKRVTTFSGLARESENGADSPERTFTSTGLDPHEQLAQKDDEQFVFDYLTARMAEPEREIFWLDVKEKLSALEAARRLRYLPETEKIVLKLVRQLLAHPFKPLAKLLSTSSHIRRAGAETLQSLVNRILDRTRQSPVLSGKIERLAKERGTTPEEVVKAAGRLLLNGRTEAAAEAMRAARMTPRRGETEKVLTRRLLARRKTSREVNAILVKLEDQTIAERLGQNRHKLAERCEAMVRQNDELRDAVAAIRRRAAQRGIDPPEVFRPDDGAGFFEKEVNQLEEETDEDKQLRGAG